MGLKARVPDRLKQTPKHWQAKAMTAAARRLRADVSPADALLLTSTPRSGSTWLFELLAADPTTFPLFEPFHPGQNPHLRPFADQLGAVAHPTTHDGGAALRHLAEEIYAGRELTRWSTNRTPRRRLRAATRTLIKEVRISRALGWFGETLPVPTVVLVRHPCAVVDSLLRATAEDWNRWTHAQVSATLQAALPDIVASDLLDPRTDNRVPDGAPSSEPSKDHTLLLPDDRAVLLAAVWAMDVRCALEAIRDHDRAIVVTYERLFLDKDAELRRIGTSFGLDTTHADTDRPSLTTLASSPLHRGADPLTSWQSRLPPDTVRAIVDVTHRLGVPLYTADPLPNAAAFAQALA